MTRKHLASLLLSVPMVISAQTPICDELPISYDPAGINFTTGEESFGDSVITVPITNDHPTQGMAYPQAKVVPLTPLPPGMVLNTHWYTFASSWNPGQTMPANFFFDVATPIPMDYMVTFELWAYNLTPLLEDSCIFDSTFTINLNPGSTGIHAPALSDGGSIWPVPVADRLNIAVSGSRSSLLHIKAFDPAGGTAMSVLVPAAGGPCSVDVSHLDPGVYLVTVEGDGVPLLKRRVVVAH